MIDVKHTSSCLSDWISLETQTSGQWLLTLTNNTDPLSVPAVCILVFVHVVIFVIYWVSDLITVCFRIFRTVDLESWAQLVSEKLKQPADDLFD